jgi:hypothetical protein
MAVLTALIAGAVLAVVASIGLVTQAPDTPDKTTVSVPYYGHR